MSEIPNIVKELEEILKIKNERGEYVHTSKEIAKAFGFKDIRAVNINRHHEDERRRGQWDKVYVFDKAAQRLPELIKNLKQELAENQQGMVTLTGHPEKLAELLKASPKTKL